MRSPIELVVAGVLVALMIVACVIDVRERRIPNVLVATVLLVGVLATTAFDPILPGLLRALAGFFIGLAIWIPGWFLRMIGAGDVKLFAAAGAWLGPAGAANAAIAAAVFGGSLALVWLLARRGLKGTGWTLWAATAAPRRLLPQRSNQPNVGELIPYSLAITAGVVLQLSLPGLVF